MTEDILTRLGRWFLLHLHSVCRPKVNIVLVGMDKHLCRVPVCSYSMSAQIWSATIKYVCSVSMLSCSMAQGQLKVKVVKLFNVWQFWTVVQVGVVIIIIIISTTMFMVLSSWQSHCKSSPGSFDECRMVPSGRRPKTKPDDLGCETACTGCQKLHPPSPFIITQPESWYSFYRPTEGRKLSWHSWLVTYRDGLPVHRRSPILVLTRSDVAQLRWSKPTHYH